MTRLLEGACLRRIIQRHIPRSIKGHMVVLSGYMDSRKLAKILCQSLQCKSSETSFVQLDMGSVVHTWALATSADSLNLKC